MTGSILAVLQPILLHAFDKISLKHGNISHTETLGEIIYYQFNFL